MYHKKVLEYIAGYHMLEKEDKVIVGVSGGADSVCLLFMLLNLRETMGIELIAVHVNHGLRGEDALRDECYVKNLCRRYQILCEVVHADVELIAKKRKQSLEEAGRNVRREAFQTVLEKYRATKIALAHHKNDNAETLLMNLSRGSGLKGLGGISPVNENVIRPLLCLSRREIEKYLDERNIDYCVDKTNLSNDYTRNRIRNKIIPLLEEGVNEKAVDHMSDAMETIRETWEYMESRTKEYYEMSVEKKENGLFVLEEEYNVIPKVFQKSVWKTVLFRAAGAEKDIHVVHIKSLMELMSKQTGRKISLPYHLEAKRCYEGIHIYCDKKQEKPEAVPVDFTAKDGLTIGDTHISFEILETNERKEEKTYTKSFDYDIMKNTVMVRTRAPGDYITIDKDGRRQKLKSYFINEKIPEAKRDEILLLAEGSHVLWIIGYRRGYAYHIGENTKKIITVTAYKGEKKDGRDN